MNHSLLRAGPTGRPHWLGEHGSDTRSMTFNRTPLSEYNFLEWYTQPMHTFFSFPVVALGFTLFVFGALLWYCISPIFRTRMKTVGYADHDPEAAIENEPILSVQRNLGSVQNSKEALRSTLLRTRSLTLPHPVYDPFKYDESHPAKYRKCRPRQHERTRSLSLSCPLHLYRPDAVSSSTLIEYDLYPPPEYSSLPGSPNSPTLAQELTPLTNMTPRILGVGCSDKEALLSSTSSSCPDFSFESRNYADWNGFSLSQPTITRDTLSRKSFFPGSTANDIVPESLLHTLRSFPASAIDKRTTRLCGTHDTFVSGHIIPRLSSPSGQVTASDSIVTISPCHMIATARGLSDTALLSDDRVCEDSCQAFASESVRIPHRSEIDEDGTNSLVISA